MLSINKQNIKKILTTFGNGSLGSHNDEERSKLRKLMRITEIRESSNL